MDPDFSFPDFVLPGQLICPEFNVKQEGENDVVFRYICGPGAKLVDYKIHDNSINVVVSTLVGKVNIEEDIEGMEEPVDEEDKNKEVEILTGRITKTFRVSVHHNHSTEIKEVDKNFASNLPKEGDIVLTRVTRISSQRANMEILAVENQSAPIDSGVGSNGHGFVAPGGGSGSATYSVSQTSSDFGEPFRGILRSQDVRATERDRVKIIENFKPGDIVRAQILSLGDGTNYYLTTARNDLGVVFAKSGNGAGGLMYALDWQTMVSPTTGVIESRKCAKPI